MTAADQLDGDIARAFYGAFPALRDIQESAIPPLLSGENLVLTAGTGSGKTEAVLAPLLSRRWRDAVAQRQLICLYLAPTKALVNDLEKRLVASLDPLGLRVGVRHGDRDDLTRGVTPQLLITTPESLEVLLFRNEPQLRTIRSVVIDEVHLLYNTQRGLHLSILLNRLRNRLSEPFQWAAISATVGRLDSIRDFLMGSKEDTAFISSSTQRTIDAQVRHPQTLAELRSLIARLVRERPTKLLLFVNSRKECERVAHALLEDEALADSVLTHYSSLSAEMREETECRFSSLRTAICIATSTLELGIDIGDIDAVMLWGVPSGVESFLQRIGRGNRRTQKTNVICLVPDNAELPAFEAMRFLTVIGAAKKGMLPEKSPYELFGAVAQQSLSIVASDSGRYQRIADLLACMGDKGYLTREIFENILAELAAQGFLKRHGFKNRFGADEELYRLVDMKLIYGNFPVGSQTVGIFHGAMRLGEVPAINLLRFQSGASVRFLGKRWRVKKNSRDGIYLEPSNAQSEVMDFSYGGKAASVDPFVINEIWSLIFSDDFPSELLAAGLESIVDRYRKSYREFCSYDEVPFQRTSEGIRYDTFGGYLVNRAIGFLTGKAGFKANDVSLFVASPIDWKRVPVQPIEFEPIFHLLYEDSSGQSLYQKMLPPEVQLREFLQSWLHDSVIAVILKRLAEATPVELPSNFVEA